MEANREIQTEKNNSIIDNNNIKEKKCINFENIDENKENIKDIDKSHLLYVIYSAIFESGKKEIEEEKVNSEKKLENNNLSLSSIGENKISEFKPNEKIKINEKNKIDSRKKNINNKKSAFKKININGFYLLDEYSSVKDIQIDNKKLENDDDCIVVYLTNNKKKKSEFYEKEKIKEKYYSISIFNKYKEENNRYQKEYKLLFPYYKYSKTINESYILDAIRKCWFCEYLKEEFKINLDNINLSKINNDDKQYDIVANNKNKSNNNNIINTNCNGSNIVNNNNSDINNINVNFNCSNTNNNNNNYKNNNFNNYNNSINICNNFNNNYNYNNNNICNNNNNNYHNNLNISNNNNNNKYSNNENSNNYNNNSNNNYNNTNSNNSYYNNKNNNNNTNSNNYYYNNNLNNNYNNTNSNNNYYNNNDNNNNNSNINSSNNNYYNYNSNNKFNNNNENNSYYNNNINSINNNNSNNSNNSNNNNYPNNYNTNSYRNYNNNNSNIIYYNNSNNNQNNNDSINYSINNNNYNNNMNIYNNNSNKNYYNNNTNNNYNNNLNNSNNNNSNNIYNININNSTKNNNYNTIIINKINNKNSNNNANNYYNISNINNNNSNQINNNNNFINNKKTILMSKINNNNKNNSNNNKINNDNDNDDDNDNQNKENFKEDFFSNMESGTVIISSKKKPKENINNISYFFPLVGLNNVGSTCFMNATLQCLLHVSELSLYFLKEFPNDQQTLRKKNSSSESHGSISEAYCNLVNSVYEEDKKEISNSFFSFSNSNNKSFAPRDFKKKLGHYNPQFKYYEANDSKDLILYLLQTFHEELNYMGDQPFPTYLMRPDQLNRANSFNYFMQTYNIQNFSIASKLFFGTYENRTMCCKCRNLFFSFQKFEFISFPTHKYAGKTFNILDGFKDNREIQDLTGDNQYFCQICQAFCDGKICCCIIQPPNKLVINIDYGINKRFKVKKLIFEEIIDITDYINFNFNKRIKYQIAGICTHLGSSGSTGHYIAFCRNKSNGKWYNFNDSTCSECNKDYAFSCGNPYLLIYEQI